MSSLLDLESRHNRLIEEKILLEEELVNKSELQVEVQRLKDELRGKWAQPSPTRSRANDMTAHARRPSRRNGNAQTPNAQHSAEYPSSCSCPGTTRFHVTCTRALL